MSNPPLISIVIPMYNEQSALPMLFARLQNALASLQGYTFEYVCVNDGSTDTTLIDLQTFAKTDAQIVVVDLSRNFGKEAALSAGLLTARGAAVIPIDADLQDPPELIKDMLALWEVGYEVVLCKREDRATDSLSKRLTASLFYKLHNKVADITIPENVGDFRLMDRVVVDAINALPESTRFMKGLFAWVGFRTTSVAYAREPRSAGNSKFNAWRLWNLEGITSFSLAPLKIWTYLGVIVSLAALTWGSWIAVRTLIYGVDVPGYASVMVAVLTLGGLQLIGIGVIGEYLGRAFMESKRRPVFIIRNVYRSPQIKLTSQPETPASMQEK